MKVLVTGGAGFIGSHLAQSRLARGDDVAVLDDLSTGSIDNVEPFRDDPAYQFVYGSLLDTDATLLSGMVQQCDAVFHLAAAVGVQYVVEHPSTAILVNFEGTRRILEACARFGKRVLFTSSSEVYGQGPVPMRESDDVVDIPSVWSQWTYAVTKRLGERFALGCACGASVVIARLFNTAGPRQTGRYGMVLPRFAHQAVSGAPITVYGDGAHTRTFAHVTDTVECLNRLMACEAATGEIVNVGGREEVSMLELARRVKARALSDSAIARIPYASTARREYAETPRRVPSTEKLQRLIGYTPTTSLDTIVDDVLAGVKRTP